MIRVGILGDIGSGKSYISKSFGFPVFNADLEVSKIYQKDKRIYNELIKELPGYFTQFPIKKSEVSFAILANQKNLKKIVRIVHKKIRKKMKDFLKKNKKKKIVILDIPLLLENKINKKNDILIFVQTKKIEVLRRLKKRKNFNKDILNKFKNIQLPLDYKKKNSNFIIKNDFTEKTITKHVNYIFSRII